MFANFELLPFLVALATFLLGLFEGKGVVPVVSWLKARLNTSGIWTIILAGLASLVFGALTVFAGGQITPEIFDTNHVLLIVGTVFMAGQAVYADWKNSQ